MGWRLKDVDDLKTYNIVDGDTLGRVTGTYVFPKASKMSKTHCKFFIRDGEVHVLDLGSTNGIKVGIEKLAPSSKKRITPGDEIQMGEKRFWLEQFGDVIITTKTQEKSPEREIDYVPSPMTTHKDQVYDFSYHGPLGEFAKIMFFNSLFTLLSVGIYIPFAKTRMRRFIWKSTTLGKTPFIFKGDGWQLLKAYFILGLIFAAFVIAFGALDRHLATTNPMLLTVTSALRSILIWVLILRAQFSSYAYLMNHTSFRSIMLHVDRKGGWPYFGWTLLGALLFIPTIGLITPFIFAKQEQIKWANTSYGKKKFDYTISKSTYAKKWYFGMFLTFITFGIYYPWHAVAMHRYKMGNLHFDDATFNSSAQGSEYLVVCIKCFFIVVLTLGLGAPYVFNLVLAFFMNNLSVEGQIDFAKIQQGAKSKRGGVAEALIEVADMDGVDII